jgi:hypothetical protein
MVAAMVLVAPLLAAGAPPRRPAAAPDPLEEEAGRQFERGQRHYNEGKFEEAIVDYREAYRIKPHPAGLYNIAQAYERLLHYSEAVAWFERYLKDPGADLQTRSFVLNRLRVLKSLPARVQVDCVPSATALLVDQDGIVEQAPTPTVFRVKAGHYTLQVVREGYVAQERRIVVDLGQPYFHQFTLQTQQELVRVRPNPLAARVILDEKLVGSGFFADRIPVGRHRLLVEYGQYEPYASEFDLKPGHRLEIDVALKPPPPAGRIEFIAASAVFGALAVPLGLHAGGVLKSSDQLLIVSTGLGGAGLFALAGFYATPHGIREANSALITAGATWGGMEGLALGLLADHDHPRLATGLTLGGGVVGLGTALLLVRPLQATPGQSAILNSGGIWGSALGIGLGYAIRGDRRDLDLTLIIGLNVGLITSGVLINQQLDISRTRVFLIDLGGLAGSATGFAVAFATYGGDPTKSNAGTARLARGALIGGAAGLLTAAIITRRYDGAPRTITRDSLVSFDGTRLQLGLPSPTVSVVPREDGAGRDARVTLRLASGVF